jgi:hypothetical protein
MVIIKIPFNPMPLCEGRYLKDWGLTLLNLHQNGTYPQRICAFFVKR